MGKSEKKSKKKHKEKRKEHKEKHKSRKSKKHTKQKDATPPPQAPPPPPPPDISSDEDFAIPIALMNSKSHAPETPEEYQRRQSQIRREVDPVTGRIRLIKGDSEVLEEIVSKERHTDINKKATRGDGEYYESRSLDAARRKK
ncbi:GL23403 [Drosophila persimilis]|uniref:ADP-ribosylation factor-like protein 6-interacting protein 4 n=2 Tax=pseudoobscura subgroup TaxID=32358 RepID=A0A6I8UPJ4_DROPS|nr:ADP-ribosylation factor-like protein 6-interacting protein 4 [Drosophila pseudoobscura]XP_002013449.1 ADP-ribosylation factor-like protein 6-interacting protein 4 [Drosophila persimilis]XP_017144198.1 ADP-ribosylation factor-like protein 6-interacting protein 4 [Drosophila miranda]EDW24435.1 GL23403 [Drosophila persimilis]